MSHRILFVTESLFPLGPAEQLFRLSAQLVNRGHEILVAVLGQRTFEPTQWTGAGIEVHFLNGDDQTPLHNFRDGYFVVRELRKLIRETTPNIVHSWCGAAELMTMLATEDFPLAKPMNQIRLISTELQLQPEKRFVRQVIEKKMAQRVERMIVPHVAVKRHLIENGYREPRIEIIPNSISAKRISVSDVATDRAQGRQRILSMLGLPNTVLLAGTVAPLIHRSRLKDLIFATNLLDCAFSKEWYAENKPGQQVPDVHFLVIGKGTQRKQLKRFSILTEAKPKVHFLGHPESPEEIVAGLDVYWHSHLRDPLSGNLLAAMAKGIPAISVFGPGSEEIIHHQETGFAVNFGARDEFARWTKYLIEQNESGKQLARQGQTFVQSNFEESKMVDSYVGIYDLTS